MQGVAGEPYRLPQPGTYTSLGGHGFVDLDTRLAIYTLNMIQSASEARPMSETEHAERVVALAERLYVESPRVGPVRVPWNQLPARTAAYWLRRASVIGLGR
jgi:hypothetical protein